MVESFNYGFKHGHLNITQKQGIIKVVPKKRKNRLYLENWRPISLLNIDYKIAAKTIARRISKLLPKLISEDQTGYIKGRYIGQNIRLIKDILRVSSVEAIPGLAIFIDFKKAFDSVDWSFLSNTLEAFNFGPQGSQLFITGAPAVSLIMDTLPNFSLYNAELDKAVRCPAFSSLSAPKF